MQRLTGFNRASVALSLFTFVVAAYLAEVFLFCCLPPIDPLSRRVEAARSAMVTFDRRTRYQVFRDIREEGVEVYLSMNGAQLPGMQPLESEGGPLFPLAGISRILTLHCNETGEYTFYTADENGFSNPMGLYAQGNIILIGDSFTHGNCVPAGEDIASQLRERQKNVVNLGYQGNGPLMKLATLKEYAFPFGVEVVLWLYYEGNDLQDLQVEEQSPILMAYLDNDFSQRLLDRQQEIDRALIEYVEARAETLEEKEDRGWLDTPPLKVARLQHLRQRLQMLSFQPFPSPPPLFREVLEAARDLTTAGGGRLYFVYLPSWNRYAMEANEGELFHRDQVLSMVRSLNIPIIDVHTSFSQHPDPLSLFPFRLEGHYTAEGYELVASTIDSYLEELSFSHSCDSVRGC